MNTALIGRLIVKDWHLTRPSLAATVVGGALSLWLITRGGLLSVMGLSAAFVVLVLVSVLVPIQTIVNERKKQNLAFVMSLPISPADYAWSKLLANFSMFGVLWTAVTAATLLMLNAGGRAGWIPVATISALAPMVAFFLLIAVAMVVESEFWALVTQGACNVSYSFIFMLLLQNAQLRGEAASGTAVWSPLVLAIIASEIAAMVLSLGLAFYLQSRKTHFV
jgi:hypothetical protein